MMNATLRGKPDAGNPHVRFDEGEVASAKPRRGSLLYKKLMMMVVAAAVMPMFGKVCHWTGLGENNKWTTPANWLEEEVPGIIDGDGHVLATDSSDSAVFGPVTAGAHIQVDVAGQRGVSNITFVTDAPAYEFVNSTGNSNPLVGACGGSLVVEAGVTNDITFTCAFFPGGYDLTFPDANQYDYASNTKWHPGITYSRIYTHTHNGTGKLRYNGYWWQSYNLDFRLYGTGDITLTGSGNTSLQISNYMIGKLILSSPAGKDGVIFKMCKAMATYTSCTQVEVAEGRYLKDDWGTPVTTDNQANSLHVTGAGVYGVRNSRNFDGSYAAGFYDAQAADQILTFDCPVEFCSSYPQYFTLASVGGVATFVFNGGVIGKHREFQINNSSKLRIPAFGTIGCEPSATGVGTNVVGVTFGGNGALEYTGAGETTTKTIGLCSSAYFATIRNIGTGALELGGSVTQLYSTANLRLNAETAPIVFTGIREAGKTLNVAVTGAAGVTMPRSVNVSACKLESGTLRFAAGSGNVSIPSLVLTSGDSKVVVPSGADLEVTAMSVTSGTVDFQVEEGSRVIAPNVSLASIRYNGYTVKRDAATGVLTPMFSAWKNAQDGDWNVAGNWSNGVPGEGFAANVNVAGADYEVAIDAAPAEYPGMLTIANAGAGSTTVRATVPLGFTNMAATVGAGGRLVAEAGLVVTNPAGLTAALTVSTGGVVEVTGGMFDIRRSGDLLVDGGKVAVKGTASVTIPNNFYVYNGEVSFEGDGTIERVGSGGTITVVPNRPGTSAKLTMGNVRNPVNLGYPRMDVDGGLASSTGRLDYCATETNPNEYGYPRRYHSSNYIGLYAIGYKTGTAIMEQSGGFIVCQNLGIKIGACYRANNLLSTIDEGLAPTGILKVTGGWLQPSGWGGAYCPFPCGLVVGDGTLPKNSWQPRVYGRVEFSGGTITPNVNATIVGIGQGEGEFIQTGGSLDHSSLYTADAFHRWQGGFEHSYPFAIGVGGGIGTYVLSNGTVTVNARHDVYVGGVGLYELSMSDQKPEYLWFNCGYDTNRHDAVGRFLVRGGTLKANGGIVVGADGSGTLEFAAASGAKYTVGKDIVLSNNTASALVFTLNAAGRPDLTVNGKLIVNPGSKLKIDASDFPFASSRVCLVEPVGGVVGTFAEEDVEIIPPKAPVRGIRHLELITNLDGRQGLWLQRHCRTTVILR